jgi:NAD(P)-dependent dehydrogenase (short-subunit alcohol dehydrogenase family)
MADPIVLVTGAGGALGGAVARRAAKDGMRVVLADLERGRTRLGALAAELGAGRARVEAFDLADPAAWAAALGRVKAELGGVPTRAVLVAGAWQGGAAVHEAKDDAVWRAMTAANADTAYHALRALLPGMFAAKDGSVVLIGSRAVERPWTSANAAEYGASKAAVVALAQAIAQEVLEHGVRVNSILPSTMDTPANRAAMPNADPARWVSTESAAAVCAFLLSDASRDVSGAAIPVYGRA